MYHASYTPDYFCQLSCNPNNYSSSPSIFGSENTRVGGFAGARGVGVLDLVVVLVDDVLLYFSVFNRLLIECQATVSFTTLFFSSFSVVSFQWCVLSSLCIFMWPKFLSQRGRQTKSKRGKKGRWSEEFSNTDGGRNFSCRKLRLLFFMGNPHFFFRAKKKLLLTLE